MVHVVTDEMRASKLAAIISLRSNAGLKNELYVLWLPREWQQGLMTVRKPGGLGVKRNYPTLYNNDVFCCVGMYLYLLT